MSDIIPEGILYGNLGVGSGTTNYNDLDNKPQINSVTLQGNKTASELGLVGLSDIPVTSVNGETGAVVLDGTEIEFSTGVSINEKILAVEQEIPVIAYPVTSVNGETGAVVLDGTEINYQAGKTINQKIDEVEAEIPIVSNPVTSVNGETGAVVLDGTDIEYSSGVSVNSQIDTLMQYIPVYGNTASGAIATFDTSLALPLQDCTIAINAVQESGTPTPSSPKAISGFTGANIRVVGSNLWDEDVEEGYINSSGTPTANANSLRSKNFLPCTPNTAYYCYIPEDVIGGLAVCWYDINQTFISRDNQTYNVTSPANARFFKLSLYNYKNYYPSYANNISLNYPATDTAYHAYNANSTTTAITWQDEAGTVYGGSLDVTSGVLTVTHKKLTLDNTTVFIASGNSAYIVLSDFKNVSDYGIGKSDKYTFDTWGNVSGNVYSTFTIYKNPGWDDGRLAFNRNGETLADFTASLENNPINVIYELATPVTYQLTPTQISAIVGTNNVFTDTNGNTSVMYACSLKDYIEGQ